MFVTISGSSLKSSATDGCRLEAVCRLEEGCWVEVVCGVGIRVVSGFCLGFGFRTPDVFALLFFGKRGSAFSVTPLLSFRLRELDVQIGAWTAGWESWGISSGWREFFFFFHSLIGYNI
jgi:hypothetical protein